MQPLAILVPALLLLVWPTVAVAQLRVISSGGIRAAYDQALPTFASERSCARERQRT